MARLLVLLIVMVSASEVLSSSVPPVTEDTKDLLTDSSKGPLSYHPLGSYRGSQGNLASGFKSSFAPPSSIPQRFQTQPKRPFLDLCGIPGSTQIDPYFLHLLAHYMRYLPYGLGPQGFFGSTGLPPVKPPGLFRVSEKVDNDAEAL